jgi:hypothetical protein
LAVIPEAGRAAWARGSDIEKRLKGRREAGSNRRGKVLWLVDHFGGTGVGSGLG